MKNGFLKAAFWTAGISILAVSRVAAQGEIVPAPFGLDAPKTDGRKRSFTIQLQFVQPKVMAYWLDPKNQPVPAELAFPGAQKSPFLGKKAIQLPQGVDRIIAIEPQNALLVFGTEVGVSELRDIINFLDRPLRQAEVEAHFISIQSASLTGIWADLAAKAHGNWPAMGLIGGDTENQLSALLLRNQARMVTLRRSSFNNQNTQIFSFAPSSNDDYISPRLTIPNRPPGDYSSPMPVIPPPKGAVEMPGLGRISPPVPNALKAFEGLRLEVTPTFSDDGSVTLEIESSGLITGNSQSLALVRDGQTLAFVLPRTTNFSNRAFLLLTPRIVRRAPRAAK